MYQRKNLAEEIRQQIEMMQANGSSRLNPDWITNAVIKAYAGSIVAAEGAAS